MKNIKPLKPFQLWTLQNFPFIEADFDVLTNYEMMCKIVEYLNNVIDNSNKQNENIIALAKLVEELQHYLDNLDLQDEVDNKLDEMAESGQLADIIAQYLDLAGVLAFDTVADLVSAENITNGSICKTLGQNTYNDGYGAFYKIRTITSSDVIDGVNIIALNVSNTLIAELITNNYISKLNRTPIYLGTYFDNNNSNKINFVTSNDGYNFANLNLPLTVDEENVSAIYGRDPQITFIESTNLYYLTTTGDDENNFGYIYTSSDLKNWTKHVIELDLSNDGDLWAPEFFIDGNNVYLLFSYQPDGGKFQPYMALCSDINELTFSTPVKLNVNYDTTNIIDATMIKVNNIYYLAIKSDEENNLKIIIETSNDLTTWTVANEDVVKIGSFGCEGMQLLYINGKFNLYLDCYSHLRGIYGLMQTSNIQDFGKIKIIESLCGLRHGSFTLLNDNQAHYVSLLNEYNKFIRIYPNYEGQFLITENTKIIASPNVLYAVTGTGDLTIDIANPYNMEEIPVAFFTSITSSLTIGKVYKADGTYWTLNKKISNSNNQNEKLFKIRLISTPIIEQTHTYQDITSQFTFTPNTNVTVNSYVALRYDNFIHINLSVTVTGSINSILGSFNTSNYPYIFNETLKNDKWHNVQIYTNGNLADYNNPTSGTIGIVDKLILK